jgi:roadblock/LC7 domain-containing protein
MALSFLGRTKIKRSSEVPVQSGQTVTDEGMALVKAMENGEMVVKPAAGGDGASFAGFSYGHVFTPVTLSVVEEVTVPEGGGSVTLQHEPMSGQYMVYDVTADSELSETADSVGAVASGEFYLDGKTLTFHEDEAEHTAHVQYRYEPTAFEVMMQSNINLYTVTPTDYLTQIGMIEKGDLYTNMFDASVDWSSATSVKLASGGLLTDHNGDGDAIDVEITHYPSIDEPFLGIKL